MNTKQRNKIIGWVALITALPIIVGIPLWIDLPFIFVFIYPIITTLILDKTGFSLWWAKSIDPDRVVAKWFEKRRNKKNP
jgi:hypothetical protein